MSSGRIPLEVERHFHELSKSGGVVVGPSFGITKRLQDNIRLQDLEFGQVEFPWVPRDGGQVL